MLADSLRSTWAGGGQSIGCWLSLPSPYCAEAMSRLGFDWVCIDLQHGLLSYSDLPLLLPAVGNGSAVPLVRVPWNAPAEIMKALDAGAAGVIVPMVNDRTEAERAVSACRYPPAGQRSFGPIRAALAAGPGYASRANESVLCLVMIETQAGLDNLDAILATPGLDGVYVGPSDLALALGLPPKGDTDEPRHAAAVGHILERCRAHGVAAGIHTSSLAYARRYLEAGFQFVNLGSDAGFLVGAAGRDLAAARGAAPAPEESTGY